VSNAHVTATREIRGLTPPAKFVLFLLADHACPTCGLAWPGVPCLMRESELGHTSVEKALAQLRERALIEVRGYPTGGRHRATEYLVLSAVLGLSTAPCVECRQKLKTPRHAEGIQSHETPKPPATRWVLEKPPVLGTENPPPRGAQASIEAEASPRASAREAEPRSAPATPAAAAPAAPLFEPPQPPRAVAEIVARILAKIQPDGG
jgi:hypothetical protein